MPIAPELQAKIDALEDENLRHRILRVLNGPGKKRASDEAIYENIVSSYTMATEQQARLRKWTDDEVVAFAKYFIEKRPDEYIEFLRQEKEFNEIEGGLAWGVRQLMSEWIPDLNSGDRRGLFGKFRDYARAQSI